MLSRARLYRSLHAGIRFRPLLVTRYPFGSRNGGGVLQAYSPGCIRIQLIMRKASTTGILGYKSRDTEDTNQDDGQRGGQMVAMDGETTTPAIRIWDRSKFLRFLDSNVSSLASHAEVVLTPMYHRQQERFHLEKILLKQWSSLTECLSLLNDSEKYRRPLVSSSECPTAEHLIGGSRVSYTLGEGVGCADVC